MTEVRYMISDVSRILDLPTNVLRYLEYCLSLNIKRTELGYRYYLQEDIDLLGNVKFFRDKGFHMKVIKSILPYIDKVRALDADKLMDFKERSEAALGLAGLEAQERLKAQYGKVIDINMEEGAFIYKDPSTKQVTRLSTVTIKPEEVKIQPIAQEADHSRSCEEVAAAATDAILKESHMDEETVNPSEGVKISIDKGSFSREIKESSKAIDYEEKKDNKITQISDIKQAKPNHYMGAKKMKNFAPTMQVEEKRAAKSYEDVSGSSKESKEVSNLSDYTGHNVDNKSIDKVDTDSASEAKPEEFQPELNQMLERKSDGAILKGSQDKIVQFREIMCSIVMDALRQNNHTLTNDINDTVTQSIVKEMDYMMRVREERQEERFRQLDRTIRETQIQRQQAAATKEGKKKKPSKFFQKNKVRI
jgi:DNA-binding transcriptional MerR regulator